jgi:hypothetical protein
MVKSAAGPGLALLCLLAGGCASVRLAQGPQAPVYTGRPVAAILVVAAAADPSVRTAIESAIVARLEASGARAFAAHQSLTAGVPEGAAGLEALAHRLGADSVLTVQLAVDTRVERPSVKVTVGPAVTYWGSPRAVGRPPQASYARTDARPVEEARLTASLRAPPDQRIIWSASTEPVEPTETRSAVGRLADLVVCEMISLR